MGNFSTPRLNRGTKSNILYNAIMFCVYLIVLILLIIRFTFVLLDTGFSWAMLFVIFIISFFVLMHKSEIISCTQKYVLTASYRQSAKNPKTIDKIIMKLANHYNKKWTPSPYVCCSFSHLNPKIARQNFDFSLIEKSDNKRRIYNAYSCLYQCNKCHKYVLSIESKDENKYAFIPMMDIKEANEHIEKWDFYSIRTIRPVLHGDEDFWVWENRDYNYEEQN